MRGAAALRLREALEDDIVAGRLRLGERLDETALAERFGVSRTPIREALIQLAGSGMIELRPRRGAHVTLLGPRELLESFELMGEFEAACARFAARRMTEEDRARLLAAHDHCRAARDAADVDAYYHANADFHEAIYLASRNRALSGEARTLQRRLHPYRRLQLRSRGRVNISFAEHEAILAALFAGDGALAAERLREHVVVQGERFMALLAEIQAETKTKTKLTHKAARAS
jgi:DNA-binding GntR family transcriptional regulator